MMLPRWANKGLRAALLAIVACLLVLFTNKQVTVSQPVTTPITLPMMTRVIIDQNGQEVEVTVPDFSQITFRTLGAVTEAGEIPNVFDVQGILSSDEINLLRGEGFLNALDQVDLDMVLGFEFGRVFEAGDAVSSVLRIGDLIGGDFDDFESVFTVGAQTLETIGNLTNTLGEITNLSIPEVDFLAELNVAELVGGLRERVSLGLLDSDIVQDIEDQLENVLDSEIFQDIENVLGDAGEVLNTVGPAFEALGTLADGVQLSDVPALTTLALENFPQIRDFAVEQIPFLEDVPLDQISTIVNSLDFFVRIDQLYGSPEGFTTMTQSGGFNPPPCTPPPMPQQDCADNGDAGCPHIEAFNLLSLAGTAVPGASLVLDPFFGRWVSGQAQEVEGGCGPLRAFNGGMEPTGLHPFGSAFKFALWDIEDTTDTVTTRILFRICISIPFVGRTCTPYAIPPQGIPFIPFSRDSFIPASGVSF